MISNLEKEMIKRLKDDIGYEGPQISQEQFDNMVDYIMNDNKDDFNKHEILWRLCGCFENLNYNKVVDIFIDARDSYYLPELVSYVDGNIDQLYLVNKMIETNDVDFINDSIHFCFDMMFELLDDRYAEKLIEFCNSKK
jgi:hypothetical protein